MSKSSTQPAVDEIVAHQGHSDLKKVLGSDFKLSRIITKETIAACDTMLQEAVADFFTDSLSDLEGLETLSKSPASEIAVQPTRENLLKHSFNIKSHAKMLGFTLITDICSHIVNTMNSTKLSDEKRQQLIMKLAGGLRVAFEHKIRDDGGPVGLEIRNKLEKAL